MFDINAHDPRPQNTRRLIHLAGLTQKETAKKIGLSCSTLKKYIAAGGYTPYLVQFAIESIIYNKNNEVQL